jgi:hypothetical protein
LIAFLVLAGAGLFGPGPLSKTTIRSQNGGVLVSYHRFERRLMHSTLHLRLAAGDTFRLHRSYLEYAEIKKVEPPPISVSYIGEDIAYSFDVEHPSALEVAVELKLKNKPGIARGIVQAGEESAAFWQMIFP